MLRYLVEHGLEDKRGLADEHNPGEERQPGHHLGDVDAVAEDEGREEDGDYGAGEDDAERVRDRHKGETGRGAAQHQAGSKT